MPWTEFKLNDGHKIPGVGFGSSGHPLEKTADDINLAIECGFDHIDTAQIYKNEKQVGDGLKLASLPRSDIWVTTKFSGLKTVKESIKDSLEWLGLEYVDLYLIHNPAWGGDIKDTWREMRGVKKEGWAKSIGVSNFSVDQLKEIIHDSGVTPAVNQIRFHPKVLAESEALLEFHKEHGIVTEGYSPIKPLRDGTAPGLVKLVGKIAKEKGVEPDQVLLAWSKAKGVVPITTSQTESRIRGYRAAGDIELSEEEIGVIDKEGKRRAWVYWPGIARFLVVFSVTFFLLNVTEQEDILPDWVYWPGIVKVVGIYLVAFILFTLFNWRASSAQVAQ